MTALNGKRFGFLLVLLMLLAGLTLAGCLSGSTGPENVPTAVPNVVQIVPVRL